MSAEKRPWMEAERIAASRLIHIGKFGSLEDVTDEEFSRWAKSPHGDVCTMIELQCEHTALYEALEVLLAEHSCDDGSVDYDGTKTECERCIPARAALSAAMPQKEKDHG